MRKLFLSFFVGKLVLQYFKFQKSFFQARVREERLKAYAEKKSKKPALIAKTRSERDTHTADSHLNSLSIFFYFNSAASSST